jgi:hypothetical protein
MNIHNMKFKPGILATMAIGAILITTFHSVAMAGSTGHYGQKQMSPEKIHEQMKVRLDKLAARLEIKASQQAAWEDFAKSVEMLADRNMKKPGDDADAATVSRYRAESATEFAKKLTLVADATGKLQAALSEAQRKTLNQTARRFLRENRGWKHNNHRHDCEDTEHELNQHKKPGSENRHNGS